MRGSFVGFCPRCRNKVRAPYTERQGKALIHIAKVQYGRGRYAPRVICEGTIIECDLDEASRKQAHAGFVNGFDDHGRRPFIEVETERVQAEMDELKYDFWNP